MCLFMHVWFVCVPVYVCGIYHTFLQLWLCLGALCVIDEQHAEVLSSGQWMGQDGKPRTKVSSRYKHTSTCTHTIV